MRSFTTLCLNGGGVRGALQVGALKAYIEAGGSLHFPGGIYGISIGAIMGSLIAFNFTIDEIILHVHECLRFDHLVEPLRLQHILDFHTRRGIDSGDTVYGHLSRIFATKGLSLETLRIRDSSVPLHIVASDLTKCKPVLFCDSVRVWDAIRASISLPLVFTPHTISGRVFVDGAIMCKNIVKYVPQNQRSTMLALLCDSTRPNTLDSASPHEFMLYVLSATSHIEVRWSLQNYPENVCLLTDTSTSILELTPDLDRIVEKGRSIGSDFFAKCSL